MKKLFTTLCLTALAMNYSLAQNCANPVSAAVFQTTFNQIATQPTNQKKLEKASVFINQNCLMTAQVKMIALLFTDDNFRLEFGKQAYAHTFDNANYYDVYDAFAAFSYAFRLHDFIHGIGVQQPVTVVNPVVATSQEPVFPNYAYPNAANYNGKKGCPGPVLADDVFKTVAKNVFTQPTDESKYIAIQFASDQYCLSFAQIMKLTALLSNESLRLKMLCYSFPRAYDQENYNSGIVLFSDVTAQNNWTTFAKNYLLPPVAPCKVTDAEFKILLQSIKDKRFNDDKYKEFQVVVVNHCFNVAQIKAISQEFSFGDEKLGVFKASYAKCVDQNNYYQLVDELSFSSEKDNLRNFIKNGGK